MKQINTVTVSAIREHINNIPRRSAWDKGVNQYAFGMTAREFLQTKGIDDPVTFLISHAVKDDNTPFYHMEYRTTPIHPAHVWLRDDWAYGYIVINADHPTIDVTGIWYNEYKNRRLACAMLSTEADLIAIYGEKQAASMMRHYDKEARNTHKEVLTNAKPENK